MTILIHITTIPESLQPIRSQFPFMRSHGFEIQAISSPGEFLDSLSRQENIKTHGVRMTRRITPFRDAIAIYRLIRIFRQVRPRIVHAHTPKGGLLGMLAARLAGVPIRVYHLRGLPAQTAVGPKRWLLRQCEKLACKLSVQVLCVSHSLRKTVIDDGLVAESRIKTLLNGGHGLDSQKRFNPDLLPPQTRAKTRAEYGVPADARVIGFIGRMVRDKGIVELTSAWRTLREEFPNLHLLLVGLVEPSDAPTAEAVRELEHDRRVHFTGFNWETPRLYAAMDIFCLPTYREGLPKTPLEAGAMRLPVVATRIDGCVDAVVDGVTGVLVAPRSASELTAALRRYLVDPELAARHGKAGRDRVEREFVPEQMREALLAEYRRLLSRHAPQATSPPESQKQPRGRAA